jgi:hypothetical protein
MEDRFTYIHSLRIHPLYLLPKRSNLLSDRYYASSAEGIFDGRPICDGDGGDGARVGCVEGFFAEV